MFFDIFKLLSELAPKGQQKILDLVTQLQLNGKKQEQLRKVTHSRGSPTISVSPADYLLTGEESKKALTPEGEREVSDDDIMFALWGDSEDVDKDDLDDVKRRYAAFVRERKKRK